MKIVLIAAMNTHRLIGKSGGLPWHVPADLKHFKQTTMGHAVIMGRKTYDSCGKPLPGRRNIVISRGSRDARKRPSIMDEAETGERSDDTRLEFVASLDEALSLCRQRGEEIAFIAGGAQIYTLALPRADEMILTHIDAPDAEGDTYFPEWDAAEWEESPYPGDPALTIRHYRRQR